MAKTIAQRIRHFSPKTYWKELIAVLVILLAFVFFRNERKELAAIIPQLRAANLTWVSVGVGITIVYIMLQGLMYVQSFKAIGLSINLRIAIDLFLKRNLLSVFLPAGGISSLAYTTTELRKRNLNTTQIHQAGALYGYVGLLTVFLIGVPVILYTIWHNKNFGDAWISLLVLGLLLGVVFWLVWSFRTHKGIYRWVEANFPAVASNIDEIFSGEVKLKYLLGTMLASMVVECCGIAHAFVSMYALGLDHSFEAAAIAYTVSVVLMIVSPFLRGLGAVELTMLYIFKAYGYSQAEGLGITILYRAFEFWLPLILGLLAFAWRGKQLLARIGPALLIFFLGMVNLISVLTPPLADRMKLDRFYLPLEAIHASKFMVLVLGLGLLVTSAYLIKGFRIAFWIAVVFSALSLFGHVFKALDYEEASVALLTLVLLAISYKQYRIKSNIRWVRIGFITFFVALVAICLFDALSFYFIDKQHFGLDFTWRQSIYHTARSFLLFADDELMPQTAFGQEFLRITQVLGLFCWFLLIYALARPRLIDDEDSSKSEIERAEQLLLEFGQSPMDFFKLGKDKNLFFSEISEGFTAYRLANEFAIVLDEPVCEQGDKEELVQEFDEYCYANGLKAIYYRVDENSLVHFSSLRKQKITIGQEAVLELDAFTLEGKDRKSLRNGLNAIQKKGFTTEVLKAPQTREIIDQLKAISNEWLKEFDKKEMVFSQGMFDESELISQDIIVLKNETNQIVAFLNIVPDYAKDECTYDMIRKSLEAPGGSMDALIVELITYAKQKQYVYLNLGMVPMTGLGATDSPAEKIMKFASTRLGNFKHYHSLRDFKEKYATFWENKYLIFDNDFDLLQLPIALVKVMKPNE
ncbi:MAG: phosphatidylglycerol lysyltransferase domain-containing protein [Sphingobacterium sp.]|jgi:phosphatidylglycerol lysyltransferase|uniref:phosphatidylglycerol lysyltransferase domain-containing protein n=1 Tax=Sphingobacterium sp. TaxID=341027 RepID=UPI00283BE572|nr:phosphatidylglycerol lysyltransferase domain-containing protein [Sphingobacterium sp.]MDR3009774.1 phosphatidylglycerol lysyltransferase domain-containing protein [Sphingobacterium sp.]